MKFKLIILLFITTFSLYGENNSCNNVLGGKGKFVFGQISKHQSDQYMLNTETGQLWMLYMSKQGQMFLQPVIYDNTMTGFPYSLFPSDKDLKQ